MLHKVDTSYTFFNIFFQLATLKFVAWQVEHAVVIWATKLFNLQCNNVVQQVERKCCPYYLALMLAMDNDHVNCMSISKCHCPHPYIIEIGLFSLLLVATAVHTLNTGFSTKHVSSKLNQECFFFFSYWQWHTGSFFYIFVLLFRCCQDNSSS